jgi:hypothetical protein
MSRTELLDTSVGFPLELPGIPTANLGVPSCVAENFPDAKLWHLVAWNDDVSATVGLVRGKSTVVFERSEITGLSIISVQRAKGPGWVQLSASLKSQRASIPILQSNSFREDALDWLVGRKEKIEALFDTKVVVIEGGSDY